MLFNKKKDLMLSIGIFIVIMVDFLCVNITAEVVGNRSIVITSVMFGLLLFMLFFMLFIINYKLKIYDPLVKYLVIHDYKISEYKEEEDKLILTIKVDKRKFTELE